MKTNIISRSIVSVVLVGLVLSSMVQYGFADTRDVEKILQHSAPFQDIDGSPYKEAIEYLYNNGIVQGYSSTQYAPNNAVTRAELLKIVLEGLQIPLEDRGDCFPDVKNDWYAKYVCYAQEHNMIKGYPDGTFKPHKNVTLAEGMKIVLEVFDMGIKEGSGAGRYQPYFDFVHKNNIFSTYAMIPYDDMTRGEMAFLAYTLLLQKNGTIVFDNIRDVKSVGCGLPAPAIAPTTSVVGGITRNYITDVGSKYNKDIPISLIIAFHGRTNANSLVRTYYKVAQASQGNAIVVYPSGLSEEGPVRNWMDPGDRASALRDYALFDQIVEDFSQKYCINKDRIFVVGHSLGGWFTNTLACARGDIIRAIGSVGGSVTASTCTGPTAAIVMHNPEDTLATFAGGEAARDLLLKQNSCGSETKPTGPAGGNCIEYTNCQAGAPVIWCAHSDSTENGRYYPHTWPDFAGQEIWNFFDDQK